MCPEVMSIFQVCIFAVASIMEELFNTLMKYCLYSVGYPCY